MKKIWLLMICLLLAGTALAGCVTVSPIEAPAAVGTTPAPEEPAKAKEETATLSPYFPAERITLPAGSKVIDVSNNFADKGDDDSTFWETTLLELAMTKTEAIAHFTPMLNQGEVDLFQDSGDSSEYIPAQIEYDYPEVTNYVELYTSYPYASDGVFISIIKVTLFTKDDNETIVIAQIDVCYTHKPTTGPVISYESYKEQSASAAANAGVVGKLATSANYFTDNFYRLSMLVSQKIEADAGATRQAKEGGYDAIPAAFTHILPLGLFVNAEQNGGDYEADEYSGCTDVKVHIDYAMPETSFTMAYTWQGQRYEGDGKYNAETDAFYVDLKIPDTEKGSRIAYSKQEDGGVNGIVYLPRKDDRKDIVRFGFLGDDCVFGLLTQEGSYIIGDFVYDSQDNDSLKDAIGSQFNVLYIGGELKIEMNEAYQAS